MKVVSRFPWLLCALVGLSASGARAADHIDSPAVVADPAADITDVLAWTDGGRLNMTLNVPAGGPGAMFSDAVQYVFHIEVAEAYGMAGERTEVLCTFEADQTISCWLGSDTAFVSGDASNETGLANEDGSLRVFAGVRNDPFYFNFSGLGATVEAVSQAAPNLSFYDDGCPALDATTSMTLVNQLRTEPGGDPAEDDFAGGLVNSVVVSLDLDLIDASDAIVAVWGSTRR